MPIGEVLEKAFKYPWKHKALWFYGVLLAIFSAGTGGVRGYDLEDGDLNFLNNIDTNTLIIGGIIISLVILALMILGIIITAWSQAAISQGTAKLEKGKDISRKEIGKTGKKIVWKLIVLDVLIPMLIALVLLIVVGLFTALFYFMPQPAGLWIGIGTAVLAVFALIPVAVYWGLVWILAIRFVAIEGSAAFHALGEGRRLIAGKFWWTFLYGIVQGMISGMASFVAILPLIFLGGGFIFLLIAKIYIGAAIVGILALLYVALYIIAVGYFVAFENTGWTIWWLELKKGKVPEKKAAVKKA